ncbi:MAG: replicative DNA helicase [Phycisphaerae bacterium]|nr:replicative DNA helicase [Phycisphaerae bacterium]
MSAAPGTLNFERYAPQPGRGRGAGAPQRGPVGRLFDRDPPFSLEAEMSLLGSLMLDPRQAMDVMQIVKGSECFYSEAHGAIYDAIIHTVDRRGTVDIQILLDALRDRKLIDAVGGGTYLEQLANSVPNAINAPHYARIVADKHRLRRLIDAAGQVLYDAYHAGPAEGEDVKAVIDKAESRVFEIAQEEQTSEIEPLNSLLEKEYQRLMDIDEGKLVHQGVATGFVDLDEMLGGLQSGEMVILAARPSMGKTALALNICEQIAMGSSEPGSSHKVREPMPVGLFSLEMSKASLAQRLLASWSGIEGHKIRTGRLSKRAPNDEYKVLLDAAQQLGQAPIFVDDTPGLTVLSLRARARRMVAQHKVRAIMVDYLQLLTAPGAARESRQVEVSAISRGVKALARELNVPVIALSQLNRGPEGREGNRPRLSDLRESGSLEQDADVVMLLHREEYYHVQDEDWKSQNPDKVGVAEIIIAKQRNGPTGVARLSWDSGTTRFRNYTPGGDGGYTPAPAYDPPAELPVNPPRSAGGFGGPGFVGGAPSGGAGAVGGWHAGRQTGPVANHRDGGGPERDEPEERAEALGDLDDPESDGGAPFAPGDDGPAPF